MNIFKPPEALSSAPFFHHPGVSGGFLTFAAQISGRSTLETILADVRLSSAHPESLSVVRFGLLQTWEALPSDKTEESARKKALHSVLGFWEGVTSSGEEKSRCLCPGFFVRIRTVLSLAFCCVFMGRHMESR